MVDPFFSQETCDRCGGSLASGRIMSMFNTDCLCMACKEKERKDPRYKSAQKAEYEALMRGERNFPGIGY